MRPDLTVVVPTRNRRRAVIRLLERLAAQAAEAPRLEVIVVDDGATDGTAASLSASATTWPFPLRVVQQSNAGAAVARNAGVRAGSGDIILFLDDDVRPEPGLLMAHAQAHDERPDVVAVGDLPPVVDDTRFLGVMLRYWWGSMQDKVRRPGHRYAFTDLLSGHCSIRRAQFDRLGGFDARLRCREDYELGYRVVAAGLRLRFLADAVAWHHDEADMTKVLRRKFEEGVADVHLATWHPELAASLPLAFVAERRMAECMARLAWSHPRIGDVTARALATMLAPLEAVRMRGKWQGILDVLLTYWYWRGVARAAGSFERLDALLGAAPSPQEPAMVLDLASGLEAAEARLDAAAPLTLRLVYRETIIGDVPGTPGIEPLGGRHLRPLLATVYRRAYLRALLAGGAVPAVLEAAAQAEVSGVDTSAPRDRHAAA